MTTFFLNLCIKRKRLRLEVANSRLSWKEIDTIEDYNYAKKQIKNGSLDHCLSGSGKTFLAKQILKNIRGKRFI